MQDVVVKQNTKQDVSHFTEKQMEILRNSICKGVSQEEFEVFIMACVKTKLDPFMKQIYAVPRKCKKSDGSWGTSMTIQTGIDGYRLIAERTGCYAPGPESTYVIEDGKLVSATAYIKKMTSDGTWHTVSASAHMDEYMQTFTDRSGEKKPMGMWGTMPRTMLAKCAESIALRKAFPAEMSGIYTKEEMSQAESESDEEVKITETQAAELDFILCDCDKNYRDWFVNMIEKNFKSRNIYDIPATKYPSLLEKAKERMEAYHKKQQEESLVAQEAQA